MADDITTDNDEITDAEWDAYVASQEGVCECELDWNCGCGRYGGATYLETRYAGLDADEARAYGRYEDAF
jgi:hypothetical protein